MARALAPILSTSMPMRPSGCPVRCRLLFSGACGAMIAGIFSMIRCISNYTFETKIRPLAPFIAEYLRFVIECLNMLSYGLAILVLSLGFVGGKLSFKKLSGVLACTSGMLVSAIAFIIYHISVGFPDSLPSFYHGLISVGLPRRSPTIIALFWTKRMFLCAFIIFAFIYFIETPKGLPGCLGCLMLAAGLCALAIGLPHFLAYLFDAVGYISMGISFALQFYAEVWLKPKLRGLNVE